MGEPYDNSGIGGAWVFTRSGGVWTQQGGKLVGTGAPDALPKQGLSVALSTDGNTAIVGGPGLVFPSPSDPGGGSPGTGAAWVFTRSAGGWTQQGGKLAGTGAVGLASQGSSVTLSGDGNTALVGGLSDNATSGASLGAAWVFTRSGNVWTQQGANSLVRVRF